MYKIFLAISLCFSLQVFAWNFSIVNEQNLPKDSGKYIEYEFNQSKHFPVRVRTVYIEQSKYNSSIVSQTIDNRQLLMYLSESKNAFIAINGGYFREDFLPNGLLITQGAKISRIVRNRLLDGVVINDADGNINLIPTDEYEVGFSAFQSGPLLYADDKWASLSTKKKRRRNIILQFTNSNILLINISAVTLAEAVDILKLILIKTPYTGLNLALNLDGGRSAAFVINFDDVVIMHEDDYIKTAILFVLK